MSLPEFAELVRQLTFPFPVTLYGQSYTTGWVDTNGVLSLVNPNGFHAVNGTHPGADWWSFVALCAEQQQADPEFGASSLP